MTLTPQQLINLPGYGKAKEHLIRQGQWDHGPMHRVMKSLYELADTVENAIEDLERNQHETDD